MIHTVKAAPHRARSPRRASLAESLVLSPEFPSLVRRSVTEPPQNTRRLHTSQSVFRSPRFRHTLGHVDIDLIHIVIELNSHVTQSSHTAVRVSQMPVSQS